jgi:hypothetical protein
LADPGPRLFLEFEASIFNFKAFFFDFLTCFWIFGVTGGVSSIGIGGVGLFKLTFDLSVLFKL